MRLVLILSLLGFATTTDAEGWLCVADSAVGFQYVKASKAWKPKTFNPSAKYLIRRPKKEDGIYGPGAKWAVVEVGDTLPFTDCKEEMNERKSLTCGTNYLGFFFDADLLKYSLNSSWSYFRRDDQLASLPHQPDDIYLEVGHCTAL